MLKCLAKSPDDRFSSIAELEAAMARCAQEHPWTPRQAEHWWRGVADFTCGPAPAETDEYAETCAAPLAAV